jgi:hypothetical protein
MAPSATTVETTTVPDVATLKLQAAHRSPYKELAADKFDPAAEAGLKDHKAAKVSNPIIPLQAAQTLTTLTTVPRLPPNLGPHPKVPRARALRALRARQGRRHGLPEPAA